MRSLAEAGRHLRCGVSNPPLPQLPVGQRRLLQRLLHPHHRPLLLDERRLAGAGPGVRRPALSRHYVDQNFDTYGVEYTFADGTRFIMEGRCMDGCAEIYDSFAHGTKGTAIISHDGDIGTAVGHLQGPWTSPAT